MRLEYDAAFDPPAPIVSVRLSHPLGPEPGWGVRAQVDTGADITAIPAEALARLGLEQTGEVVVSGFAGAALRVSVYAVRIALPTGRQARINVLPVESEQVLLGRDVLNSLRLLLDGPALALEVLPPESGAQPSL